MSTISNSNSNNSTSSSSKKKLHRVEYEGRLIYEWDQSFDEVNIYITPPSNAIPSKMYLIEFNANSLRVGLRNHVINGEQQYYIDEELGGGINVSESLWTLEEKGSLLHLTLTKAEIGSIWKCATQGHKSLIARKQHEKSISSENSNTHTNTATTLPNELSVSDYTSEQQRLLLERFQREHTGFDFSQAQFSGENLPDPRQFMGGFDRQKVQQNANRTI